MEVSEILTKSGRTYLVPSDDVRMRTLLSGSSVWGATSLKSLKKLLPNPRLVVDVGANIGMSSVEFSYWAQEVIAFEPHPELFKLAELNIKKNTSNKNIRIINSALGNKQNTVNFSFKSSGSLGAHITKKETDLKVEVRTLDEYDLTNLDYLKLDVEGFELNVLKGANTTCRNNLPIVLAELEPSFLSRNQATPQDVIDYMVSLGYKVYDTKLNLLSNIWKKIPRQRDRIFIHSSTKQTNTGALGVLHTREK